MMSEEILLLINTILMEIYYDDNKEKHLFGKKSIILVGDLLQLPSVSTYLNPIRQLYESDLFLSNFTPFILEKNIRQQNDKEYQLFLNKCRLGKLEEEDFKYIEKRVCGFGHLRENECEINNNISVICSLNKQRNEIAGNIMNKNKNLEFIVIKSINTDCSGFTISDNMVEKINKVNGSLENQLTLKIDCQITLIKNIDVNYGLVNGLSGKYKAHSNKVLIMQTEDGKLFPIPKIKQKIVVTNTNSPAECFYRTQFPVLISHAITVHRIQGKTLEKCHLILDESFFTYGQAYVALSRVKSSDNLHIFQYSRNAFKTNMNIVALIEYINKYKSMKGFRKSQHNCKNIQENSSKCENKDEKSSQIDKDKNSVDKIKTLFNKHFKFNNSIRGHHFNNDNFDSTHVLNFINKKKEDILTMITMINTIKKIIYNENLSSEIDTIEKQSIHPSFLDNYLLFSTPRDGKCLWHSISICLTGGIQLTTFLRFATLFTMLFFKENFIDLIKKKDFPNDYNSAYKKYCNLLYIARKNKEWGNSYHLLAISTFLNCNIYCYSNYRNLLEGQHLKYCPIINNFFNNDKNNYFICIFFSRNHFTAMIPKLISNIEMIPRIDFINI
jgi:hypothetical protein